MNVIKKLFLILLACNTYSHSADTSWPNITAWEDFQPLIRELFTKEIADFSELITLSINPIGTDVRLNYQPKNSYKRCIITKKDLDKVIQSCPQILWEQLKQILGKTNNVHIIRQKSINDNNCSHTFILHSFCRNTQQSDQAHLLLSRILNRSEEGKISIETIDANQQLIVIATQKEESCINVKLDLETNKISVWDEKINDFIKLNQATSNVISFLMTENPLFSTLICAQSIDDDKLHLIPL